MSLTIKELHNILGVLSLMLKVKRTILLIISKIGFLLYKIKAQLTSLPISKHGNVLGVVQTQKKVMNILRKIKKI